MVRDTTATRLTLGALLVTAFTLASIDSRSGDENSPLHPVRSAAATVLSPMQAGLDAVTSPVTGTVNAIGDGNARADRIAALTGENADLQLQLRDALARAADAHALSDLSAAGLAVGGDLRMGHVVAVNAVDGYSWTVTVDLGRADGVVVDSTVLDASGLVGRVVAVTEHASTVLLAADPLSTVGVRMVGSGEIGTLEGTGEDLLRLTLFNRNARMQIGEELLTFGSPGGRPFAAGIPVGVVENVTSRPGGLGQVATVRPFAGFTALNVVGIVVAPAPAPATP